MQKALFYIKTFLPYNRNSWIFTGIIELERIAMRPRVY